MPLNFSKLRKTVVREAQKLVDEYNTEVDKVISSTSAFTGEGFRGQDIIDEGGLLASKVVTGLPTAKGITYLISWNPVNPETGERYAAAVWMGFFAYGGSKFVPGRRWDLKAAKNLKMTRRFATLLRKAGIRVTKVVDNTVNLKV